MFVSVLPRRIRVNYLIFLAHLNNIQHRPLNANLIRQIFGLDTLNSKFETTDEEVHKVPPVKKGGGAW